MADRDPAAADTQDKPIWVKDLLAWLERIPTQNLTGEEWVARLEEVLAELPEQWLPEEFWEDHNQYEAEVEGSQQKEEEPSPLNDEEKAKFKQELNAARKTEDTFSFSWTLIRIAGELTFLERRSVLQEVLETVQTLPDTQGTVIQALADLLPIAETQLLRQALEIAQTIQDEFDRRQALIKVIKRLPATEPQLLQQALEAAEASRKDSDRHWILSAVVDQLPASEIRLLQKALEAAQAIQDNDGRKRELKAWTKRLPVTKPLLLKKAYEAALKLQDNNGDQSWALLKLATHLPKSERPPIIKDALKACDRIQNGAPPYEDDNLKKVLLNIATEIPSSQPIEIYQALKISQKIKIHEREDFYVQTIKDYFRLSLLQRVAQQLPASKSHDTFKEALKVARQIQDKNTRMKALLIVSKQLPKEEREDIDEISQAEPDLVNQYFGDSHFGQVLVDVSDQSELELQTDFDEAFAAAQQIDDDYWPKIEALISVAYEFSDLEQHQTVLDEALEVARKIDDESQCDALITVANELSEGKRLSVLNEALKAAEKIQDESDRVDAFITVANELPDSERQPSIQQALEVIQRFPNESGRAELIKSVFPLLPASKPQLIKQAIQIAQNIENKESRITVLTHIAFRCTENFVLHLHSSQLSTALEIIPNGATSVDQSRLLSALAPRLSSGLFPRALQLVQTKITHPAYQSESIGNLAPYLPPEFLTEALEIVQAHVPGYTYPTQALCHLIPYLSLEQLQKALDISKERDLITYPDLLSQLLHHAGRRLSKPGIRQSELDNPDDREKIVQRILKLAQQHPISEKAFADIFTALAPNIQEKDLQPFQEDVHQKLEPEFYCAQVLAAIATSSHITPKQQILVRKRAKDLQEDCPRVTALSALIPILSEGRSQVIRREIIKLIDDAPNHIRELDLALILAMRPHPKSQDYSVLADLKTDQTRVLRLIHKELNEMTRANTLVQIAPHLLPSQILEAQGITQDIQDRYQCARSLLALAAHFPEIRAEAQRQIDQVKNKEPKEDESNDKYLILHIELLSQFATTVPEQIPALLKAVEEWSKDNSFDSEGDRRTYKRRRILIALKPHLPIRLVREIDRQTGIGKAPQDLWERALFVLRSEYRQALKTGSLRNDATQEEDLLNLKDEINALTEMLLMRDLEPPVAVGILGGWGGGKSYIMHLMQTHMVAIRSQGMEEIEAWGLKDDGSKNPDGDRVNRYVGHIYQIKFDAWTYAKSNLWASLMQTIFFELDRQVSLEMSLKDIGIDPLNKDGNKIWQVLYETNEDDRQYFLEKVLDKEKLEKLNEKIKSQTDRKESWTELLWEQYGVRETEASFHLNTTKEKLQEVEKELAEKENEKVTINDNINNQNKPGNWISEILIETTNLSGFLLKRYFDKNIAEDLQKAIKDKFEAEKVDISDLKEMNTFINKIASEILDEDQIATADGKKYSLSWLALKKWLKKNRQLIITFLLLIACSIIAPFMIHVFNPQNIISQLAALIAPLIPAIGFAQNLFRSNQKWFTQAKQSVKEYQETLKTRSEDKYHNLIDERKTDKLRKLDVEINVLISKKQHLDQEFENAKNALPENKFGSLASFVSARVKDAAYENQLGVMHQVKQDLTKLSQALLPPLSDSEEYKKKLNKLKIVFPRGPARIFLYIDDLDRCPPKTVVEVLEAVQLLVKNPLFIAVLAIDERYINRALAQHYKGVLSLQGSPSAADYLEKIIQIPYRVRPIAEDALRTYLRDQVVVQDSETSGTKFNEFSPQEFQQLLQCCQEAEPSPRSLKRLTNVYKLYKVLSRTRGHRPTPKEQQAILSLLAFSSRYPDLMRGILQEIGSHYEEGRHQRSEDSETLSNVFNRYLDRLQRRNSDIYIAQDIQKLKHDVEKLITPYNLNLKEMRQIFDFVRTFSFVGDIGVDRTPSTPSIGTLG